MADEQVKYRCTRYAKYPLDTHFVLRPAGTRKGPLWLPLPRTHKIYTLPLHRRQPILDEEARDMCRYPHKDPRLYPFTAHVPPIPDAEAKEAKLRGLDDQVDRTTELIDVLEHAASKSILTVALLARLCQHRASVEEEREALLALVD